MQQQQQPQQSSRRKSSILGTVLKGFAYTKSCTVSNNSGTRLSLPTTPELETQPTYVEISVLEAKGIAGRGKHGTNNAFAVVSLGKDKCETSVIDKGWEPYTWGDETFTLEIPEQGNGAIITLSIYHRKRLLDECLGTAKIPLGDFQPSPKPRRVTTSLDSKNNDQGEITFSIAFKSETWDRTQHNNRGSSKSLNILNVGSVGYDSLFVDENNIRQRSNSCTKEEYNNNNKQPPTIHVTNVGLMDSDDEFEDSKNNRIRSARGSINALWEIQNSDVDEDEEGRSLSIDESLDSKLSLDKIQGIHRKCSFKIDEVIPEEFRVKNKLELVDTILSLRENVKNLEGKIQDLKTYIDSRLVSILETNPNALENNQD